MTLLHLLPAISSLLLMTAHFYRSTHLAWMAACLVVLAMLLVRRPWSARLLQLALVLGSLEWFRTTVMLVLERNQAQLSFVRLAVILGTVTVLTALSSLVVRSRPVRRYFRIGDAASQT